ncbi:MAG: hypothetical protein JW768_04925 [Chitinispirillaceae bacterium]|nr:hypothetical protein [Chitinispirillaceae bacterium]
MSGLTDELVLFDRHHDRAEGEAMDLEHAEAFTGHPMIVRSGTISDTTRSDIIVLACSVPWHQEFISRFDIGRENLKIFREIVSPLAEASPDANLLVVSNPVDVMTYHAITLSNFGPHRVFGTGTLIDSARFRIMLSSKLRIHPDDLRAYILGEHGDSQFPLFSLAMAGGSRIAEDSLTHDLFRTASRSEFDVVRKKGYTNFAISMAAALVIEAIAWDTRRTMPLSVMVQGFLGVKNVCLSLPVVLGKDGIVRVLEPELGTEEAQAFQQSAKTVRQGIEISLA